MAILKGKIFLKTAVQNIFNVSIMGRKKGHDNRKMVVIFSVLASNPDGLWLRRLAKESALSPATVSHYLNTALKSLIEEVSLGEGDKKTLLRVIKLKPFVFEKLQEGKDINEILKLLKLIEKIG